MKAIELIQSINGNFYNAEKPCDRWVAGDPEKEIQRVAVCMFPTLRVLREIAEWGADLMIPHEPTFNHGFDQFIENPVTLAKKKLVEDSQLVIYRLHDFMHAENPDLIHFGLTEALGLSGCYEDKNHFVLDTPISALELAKRMEAQLGMERVRICGSLNHKATKLILACGSRGHSYLEAIRNGEFELMIIGEMCEWNEMEYIRDWAELSDDKAALVLGHAVSERDGMKYLTKKLSKEFPNVEFRYFECGDVYNYTK